MTLQRVLTPQRSERGRRLPGCGDLPLQRLHALTLALPALGQARTRLDRDELLEKIREVNPKQY